MFILLILTTLINLYLFYNLNKNKSSLEKIFSIFILTNIVWTMFNYLLFHSNNTFFAIILTKLVMISSSFLPILLYLFAKNINKEKEGFPKIKNNIYILIVFIFEIFFLSNYLINGVQLNPFLIRFGYGIYVYIFFILFFSSLFTIYLYKKFKDSLGYNKIILEYFLTGFIVTAIFAIISNLILPSFFNIYSLTTIGTLSPIFVNILVYYALTRSRIADLKKIIRNISNFILFVLIEFSLTAIVNFIILYKRIYSNIFLLITFDTVFIGIIYITIYPIIKNHISGKKYYDNYDNIKFRDSLNDILNSSFDLHSGIKNFTNYIKQNTNITDLQIYLEKFPHKDYEELYYLAKNIVHTENYIFIYDIKDKDIFKKFHERNIEVISILEISDEIIGCIFWKNKINFNFYLINDLNFINSETKQINLFVTRAIVFEENKDLLNNLKEKIDEATKELENNNKKLEKANKDLKGLDQLKDDLISISSHELRTPASIVKGNVYMAQSTIKEYINTLPNNKKNNEYIEKLNRYIDRSIESIESEIRIINTLLEASRMGKSDVPIVQENVNLVSMIESQVDGFKKDAENKGLKIIYNKTDLPMAYGDRTKIEEVLGNLISNAIKYSERGAIEISTEKDEMFITVHIKDHGVGIPQKDIPELFQKFHRLNNYIGNPNDPKDTKHLLVRPGGTGLGLYVVKGLVERMGGKIWIDSKEGKGSTFSFTIPMATETNTNDNEFHSQDLLHKQTP